MKRDILKVISLTGCVWYVPKDKISYIASDQEGYTNIGLVCSSKVLTEEPIAEVIRRFRDDNDRSVKCSVFGIKRPGF